MTEKKQYEVGPEVIKYDLIIEAVLDHLRNHLEGEYKETFRQLLLRKPNHGDTLSFDIKFNFTVDSDVLEEWRKILKGATGVVNRMDQSKFPSKTASSIEDNIQTCVSSIMTYNRVLSRATAVAAIKKVMDAPDEEWSSWKDKPPLDQERPVIAHDVLGYIHLADHLVGMREPTWQVRWIRVQV